MTHSPCGVGREDSTRESVWLWHDPPNPDSSFEEVYDFGEVRRIFPNAAQSFATTWHSVVDFYLTGNPSDDLTWMEEKEFHSRYGFNVVDFDEVYFEKRNEA